MTSIIKMYQNETFQCIENLPPGELVVKYPGIDFKMLYESGKAYINRENNIGELILVINDIIPEETDKADKTNIPMLAKELNDPQSKIALNKFLATHNFSLFYSKAEDGTEILSIPGLSKGCQVSDTYIPKTVFAIYPLGLNPNEEVYELHSVAIGNRKLISDRLTLEKEVLGLVHKANSIYEKVMHKLTKRSSLDRIAGSFDRWFDRIDAKIEDKYGLFKNEPGSDLISIGGGMDEIFGLNRTPENERGFFTYL